MPVAVDGVFQEETIVFLRCISDQNQVSCAKPPFLRKRFCGFSGRNGIFAHLSAVIIVFVIAFVVTMIVVNVHAKKMMSTNTKLVEKQNTLLEQNKQQEDELEKRINELEEQLKQHIEDEVTLLQEQTRQHRERIELTTDMSDEELMAWVDQEMDDRLLYTDTNLTLKMMANSLGLTQKRLGALFKNNERYNNLGDYLNEKRFLYACRLLREKSNWTIEAVSAEAGFGGRRTFQMEVKRRLGITPLQYRQGVESAISQEMPSQTESN